MELTLQVINKINVLFKLSVLPQISKNKIYTDYSLNEFTGCSLELTKNLKKIKAYTIVLGILKKDKDRMEEFVNNIAKAFDIVHKKDALSLKKRYCSFLEEALIQRGLGAIGYRLELITSSPKMYIYFSWYACGLVTVTFSIVRITGKQSMVNRFANLFYGR